MSKGWWIVVVFFLSFLLGVFSSSLLHKGKLPEIIVKTDTLIRTEVRVDTLVRVEPRYLTERIIDTEVIIKHDTVFLHVPRMERTYGDSTYYAVVSGIDPRLDSLEIYRKTIDHYIEVTNTTTIKERPKKWGVGVQLGYGVTQDFRTMPYVGIGVSYNFLKF